MENNFGANTDTFADAIMFWGTGEIDREGETSWDPDFIGKPTLDKTFDMSAPATADYISSQQFLKNMCDDLQLQEFAVAYEDNLNCWIYGFEKFVTDTVLDPDTTKTE
jgi:hypothetical protein